MAGLHSKLTVVKLDNSAGSPTTISSYCNKVEFSRELDQKEATVFGSTSREWVSGFADGEVKLSGPMTRASDQFFTALFTAFRDATITTATFEYHPEGTDSGDVKHSCEVIMTNYNPSSDVDNLLEWSADFKVSGPITVGTN